ncbi:hypothetical protein ACIP9C_01715 [Lysinibacillus sp. NPDC093210]|uniref:hypothetical protein n=1 Tax=Lysinibacillus sp. NPDC093210 TaxID=3364133 RepID=UPI0037F377B3
MKRVIIGGIIMLSGLLITLSIIIIGTIYAINTNSKLWIAIFGRKEFGNEVVNSLFVGFPFVIGVIFSLLGFIILGYEYFKTFKVKE